MATVVFINRLQPADGKRDALIGLLRGAKDAIERGTPAQLAEATKSLNEMFRARLAGLLSDDVENLTGVAPRTFREWCERHVDELR